MSILWKNNATSALASDITAGSLSITVTTGHGDRFPEVVAPHYCMVTLVDTSGNREIVKVTARESASSTMTIKRAQEGTSARAFEEGSFVELRITKNAMDEVSKASDINAQHYVCDASAADQGATANSNSLKSIVDALGATEEATIELPHTGTGDTTTYTVGTDLTIPDTVRLIPHKGVRISPSTGVTLTANCIIEANYQIFAGDGTVTVNSYPQDQAWWGNAQRMDVTGLKVGAAVISTFIKTVLDDADAATARATLGVENIPTGTKMWFYQDAAPTGWTIDATPADAMLAVKGGSNAFNANGGTQAGTWTQPNHTHTGPSHDHTSASHVHTLPMGNRSDGAAAVYIDKARPAPSVAVTGSHVTVTANGVHLSGAAVGATDWYYEMQTGPVAPGNVGAGGTGATGDGATAATWRPLAQLGIICTKD